MLRKNAAIWGNEKENPHRVNGEWAIGKGSYWQAVGGGMSECSLRISVTIHHCLFTIGFVRVSIQYFDALGGKLDVPFRPLDFGDFLL